MLLYHGRVGKGAFSLPIPVAGIAKRGKDCMKFNNFGTKKCSQQRGVRITEMPVLLTSFPEERLMLL